MYDTLWFRHLVEPTGASDRGIKRDCENPGPDSVILPEARSVVMVRPFRDVENVRLPDVGRRAAKEAAPEVEPPAQADNRADPIPRSASERPILFATLYPIRRNSEKSLKLLTFKFLQAVASAHYEIYHQTNRTLSIRD